MIPILGALLFEYMKTKKSKLWQASFVILLIISIVVLFLTRSRGAVLALAAACFLLCLYRKWWKLLLAGVVVGAIVIISLPKSMVIHLDRNMKEQSVFERLSLWDRAWNVIEARPLTGTGINTYNLSHEKYDTTENWRVRGYYAHNGYLQFAAETGLPSLFIFFLFLFFYFKDVLSHIQRLRGDPRVYLPLGIITGLFSFLILCVVDTQLHSAQPSLTFWFLMGSLIALQKNESNSSL